MPEQLLHDDGTFRITLTADNYLKISCFEPYDDEPVEYQLTLPLAELELAIIKLKAVQPEL